MNFTIGETLLFILVSAMVLLISSMLFKRAAGSLGLTKLNMISFIFYYNLILLSFVGSVIILLLDVYYNPVVEGVSLSSKIKVWVMVQYAMIAIPSGMLFTNLIWRQKSVRIKFNNYCSLPLIPYVTKKDILLRQILYLLSFVCLFTLVYVYYNIGYIPIIESFRVNNEITLFQMRTEISRSFPGNIYIKNVFGLKLIPILSFISLSYYKMTKSPIDLLWFVIMFIATFFMLTYDFSKSPFINFILGFIFFYVLTYGKIGKVKLIKYFTVIFFLLTLVFAIITKKHDLSYLFSYNSGIIGRLIISQISGLYQHIEIFPSAVDHIGFNSLSKIFTSDFSPRSGRIVLEIVSPSWVENDYGGVYNTLFIGEAWANFGILGVLISPIWVGFIIQNFYLFFINSKKTPVLLGVLIYYSYSSNITGGYNEYIYNPLLFIIAIILVFIILFSRTFRNKIKTQ